MIEDRDSEPDEHRDEPHGGDDDAPLAAVMAASMDAPETLLPVLATLFEGIDDLGARAADVVAIAQATGLSSRSRVLDLGCGKGAAAIALAKRFGVRVHGIDGMPAFIAHARAQARAQGVADLCTFEVDDIRARMRSLRDFDLAMLLALGDTLGSQAETLDRLASCVRPGGHMLIDDAYLDGTAAGEQEESYADLYPSERELYARLEARGDRVVQKRVVDTADSTELYLALTETLLTRARSLARRAAAPSEALIAFAERQRASVDMLAGPVVGALWLIARDRGTRPVGR